jgi:hypothetical protein
MLRLFVKYFVTLYVLICVFKYRIISAFVDNSWKIKIKMHGVTMKITFLKFSILSPPQKKILAFYVIMWKNTVQPDRP